MDAVKSLVGLLQRQPDGIQVHADMCASVKVLAYEDLPWERAKLYQLKAPHCTFRRAANSWTPQEVVSGVGTRTSPGGRKFVPWTRSAAEWCKSSLGEDLIPRKIKGRARDHLSR